jgi:hypothetical protein
MYDRGQFHLKMALGSLFTRPGPGALKKVLYFTRGGGPGSDISGDAQFFSK